MPGGPGDAFFFHHLAGHGGISVGVDAQHGEWAAFHALDQRLFARDFRIQGPHQVPQKTIATTLPR